MTKSTVTTHGCGLLNGAAVYLLSKATLSICPDRIQYQPHTLLSGEHLCSLPCLYLPTYAGGQHLRQSPHSRQALR